MLDACHTNGNVYDMARIVQARIDAATERKLGQLRRRTGMSDSQLVRKGLELVSLTLEPGGATRIRGIGRFASGKQDLGSNKKHLAGFGRS